MRYAILKSPFVPRTLKSSYNPVSSICSHTTQFLCFMTDKNYDAGIFLCNHDDVIKWKHFPRYWPFVRGIHRSPVNSPHKGQWRGALMFTLICARINGWVNNCEAGDLRRYHTHYDVTVMLWPQWTCRNVSWHACYKCPQLPKLTHFIFPQ